MLQVDLRLEGANIIPFTANSLNIFVGALVDELPNVTASDLIIGQVRSEIETYRGIETCMGLLNSLT